MSLYKHHKLLCTNTLNQKNLSIYFCQCATPRRMSTAKVSEPTTDGNHDYGQSATNSGKKNMHKERKIWCPSMSDVPQPLSKTTSIRSSPGYGGELSTENKSQKDLNGYTTRLMLATMQSLCGALLTGYNTSVLNVPSAVIIEACNLSQSHYASLQSFFCLGGLIGSLSTGKIADKVGRKLTHYLADSFFIVSGVVLYLFATNIFGDRQSPSMFPLFALSRGLCGFGAGISTVVIPTYLDEISPPQIRGAIGTLNQMTVCIGIVISQIVGYSALLGNLSFWPWLFVLNMAVPVIRICTFWWFPESPKWLLTKHRKEEARAVLQLLRGCAVSDQDLLLNQPRGDGSDATDKQYGSVQVSTVNSTEYINDERKRVLRKVIKFNLCIAIGLQVLNQFSGINSVFFYSNVTLENAGLNSKFELWIGSVAIGIANVIGVFPQVYLMDKWGRKTLLYISLMGMIVSSIGFSIFIMAEYGYLSVMMLIVYVFAWELGLGPIPWFMMAELAPSSHRAMIVSVGTFTNFALALFIAQFSNIIVEHFQYFPFAIVCLVGLLMIYRFVPETKGKTEAQIQQELAAR